MKPSINPFVRIAAIGVVLSQVSTHAATVYWDGNGSTAGAGTAPVGTWGVDAFWSADPNGEAATIGWTDEDDAVFSAGADASGSYTVTIDGTITASTIKAQEGGLTLATGFETILGLSGIGGVTTPTLDIAAGASLSVGSNVTLDMFGEASQAIAGGGTLNVNGTGAIVQTSATGEHYLIIDGATQVNVISGILSHAGNASTGAGSALVVGSTAGSNAKLAVSGGVVTTNGYFGLLLGSGAGSTGTVDLNSGSVTVSNNTYGLFLNNNATGTAIFNLNGGTLTVGKVTKGNASGSSTVYFNGGTLKAGAAPYATGQTGGNFWGSSVTAKGATAYVKSGGVVIDDGGKGGTGTSATAPVAIWADLLEDAGSTGGGLSKGSSAGTPGSVALYGSSTYTGKTSVTAGTLMFNSIKNVGAGASALGAPATAANGTIDLTGTLYYNGSSSTATDRIINLTGNGVINSSGASGSTLTLNGNVTGTAGGLSLRGSRGLTVAGAILIGQAKGVTKTDAGLVTLSNATNDFGALVVASGTLSVNSIAANGTASAAGKGPTTNSASIQLGQGSSATAGVLQFTGASGGSSNRAIQLNNNSGGTGNGNGTLENTVAGQTLVLSGDVTAQFTGNAGLTLQGAGDGEMSGVIGGATGTISLTKAGTGAWKLSNVNTYTGVTTVKAGTLIVDGNQSAATGTITVGGTGATGTPTLTGSGTLGGALTIAAAGTGVVGILNPGTVGGLGTLNAAAGAAIAGTFACDLNAASSDQLAVTGALDVTGATLALNPLATPAASSYTLATSTTGVTGTFAGLAEGATVTISGVDYTISYLSNNITLAKVATGGYSSWQAANGTSQTADLDHDNDGVSNGLEYFLGGSTSTTGFTPLPAVITTAGVHSITWTKAASYTGTYPADFVVETSATLATGSWTPETLGVTVTVTGNNVTYTFPAGTKNFARLKVTGP